MNLTADDPRDRRLWLIGPMAVGKSTVGRALSTILSWPYVDNDGILAGATGQPLERWAPGAPLHRAESRLLRRTARLPPPFVAGVAASVGDRAADMALLRRTGRVVLLSAPLDELVHRAEGTGRPLGADARATLTEQIARRAGAYRAAAEMEIDTSLHDPDDAAWTIVSTLGLG